MPLSAAAPSKLKLSLSVSAVPAKTLLFCDSKFAPGSDGTGGSAGGASSSVCIVFRLSAPAVAAASSRISLSAATAPDSDANTAGPVVRTIVAKIKTMAISLRIFILIFAYLRTSDYQYEINSRDWHTRTKKWNTGTGFHIENRVRVPFLGVLAIRVCEKYKHCLVSCPPPRTSRLSYRYLFTILAKSPPTMQAVKILFSFTCR